MRINNLQITSSSTLNFETNFKSPICFFRGRHSDLALDLIRELIGDFGSPNDPDQIDNGQFVLHADMEIDDKNYNICYIRNADFMGDKRLGVNFESNNISFSMYDTQEFINKCNKLDMGKTNILIKTADVIPCVDKRPIFIYDFFDRLDESVDISPIIDKLTSLDRQVFIAVCANYPCKMTNNNKIQIINI
ncbi:MAG: hypothetical protein J6S23_00730 [Clostridia bacterium]|nr:hypothetical protein [Clostridia bacterium]